MRILEKKKILMQSTHQPSASAEILIEYNQYN